jgi:hypothetical protein
MARALNRVLRRSGRVWGDRYHRRDLATPHEVRHALVYVLDNVKKHQPADDGLEWRESLLERRRRDPGREGDLADRAAHLVR